MKKEELIEAENFILRMVEEPVHCDDTGGIKLEYLLYHLEEYMDWTEERCMSLLSDLKEEGCILMANGHVTLNFSFLYPETCEKFPGESAGAMWVKHKNKCIENSLKVKKDKLSFLDSLEEHKLRRIIDQMMGIVEESKITHKFPLEYPTRHLNGYDNISLATGIIGKEYRIIKKAVWYSILSTKIAESKLRLGGVKTDGRFSILIVLGSGKGKGEFKSVIKDLLKKIKINKISDNGKTYESEVRCEELTVFHPDQFIGKVKVRNYKKDRIAEPIEGFLALDYLIMDEARDLLTAKEPAYSESRRALRLGADGKEIYKKNVDAKLDEGLKYISKCVFCIFVQPKSLDADFVLDGDARRFAIAYVNLHGVNQDEARARIITADEVNEEKVINKIIEEFNGLIVPYEFKVDEEAKKTFGELSELLYRRGMAYSHKIADFTEINKFTINNMLLKMSAIQALQSSSDIISKKHIELAFVDYCEILEHTYEYIESKVMGSLNYQEKWQGATGKDQDVLEWLHFEGASSKESSQVSIAEYKDKIIESFGVKDRQAGNILKKHRSNGWIESTQEQHSSKIWIKFIPDSRVAGVAGMHSGTHKKIQKKYSEIIYKYEMNSEEKEGSGLQPCNHYNPDDILNELEMEISGSRKERKSTEYLIMAYENDIAEMKREISEISESEDDKTIELEKNIETYSRTLDKLKAKMKTPIAILNQPFSLIERSTIVKGVLNG